MIRFEILQLPISSDNIFTSLSIIKKLGLNVNISEYSSKYEGDVDDNKSEFEICEYLYKVFNMNRPEDFHGHSLSVSDIIKLGDKYFYCDSFGFVKL